MKRINHVSQQYLFGSMDMVTIALEGEKGFLEEIRTTVTFQLHKHTNDDF